MPLEGDGLDALDQVVIGDDLADIVRKSRTRLARGDVHIDAHALRGQLLPIVDADGAGQHQIADENAVDARLRLDPLIGYLPRQDALDRHRPHPCSSQGKTSGPAGRCGPPG